MGVGANGGRGQTGLEGHARAKARARIRVRLSAKAKKTKARATHMEGIGWHGGWDEGWDGMGWDGMEFERNGSPNVSATTGREGACNGHAKTKARARLRVRAKAKKTKDEMGWDGMGW